MWKQSFAPSVLNLVFQALPTPVHLWNEPPISNFQALSSEFHCAPVRCVAHIVGKVEALLNDLGVAIICEGSLEAKTPLCKGTPDRASVCSVGEDNIGIDDGISCFNVVGVAWLTV
jgi:hypothetical protein